MSQFMLCKSKQDLTEQKCIKLADCDDKFFLLKVAEELFSNDMIADIWVRPDIDSLFTQAHEYNNIRPFETTELYLLLSTLFDVSEVLILWYSNDYHDLDHINTKEHFFDVVKESIRDSMFECYV